MTEPLPSSSLGPALRRWRLLHRVKQTHAAELLGVAQSTISRWESGTQALLVEERARLERLLGARLEAAADQALARLVEANPQPVHLICDLTHRLLACSPARAAQFGVPLGELLDRSLWPYCSEEILARKPPSRNSAGANCWHRRRWSSPAERTPRPSCRSGAAVAAGPA